MTVVRYWRGLRFAEAVEEVIEEDAEDGIDETGDAEAHGEPGLRLSEQQFLHEHDDSLMHCEERESEREARQRMLRIEPRANGRGKIADHGFCDSKKAQWSLAQTVLQQADESAKQQSAGGVSAAQPKMNRDEQRQVQNVGRRDVHRQKRLQYQRKNHAEQNRSARTLMDFNVRFTV